jgi:hypothetical protein
MKPSILAYQISAIFWHFVIELPKKYILHVPCFTIFLKRAHFKLSFEPKIIKFGFVVAEIQFFEHEMRFWHLLVDFTMFWHLVIEYLQTLD